MVIETRHVKLDYVTALGAKKDLLNAEINLLHIVRKMKGYRQMRKKEMATKNKLRIELGKLRKSMDNVQKDLPADNVKLDKRKMKEKKGIAGKGSEDPLGHEGRNLDSELLDIKRKLEKLGGK